MRSTDAEASTAVSSRRRNQRVLGGVAAGSTLGLAAAHLLVNLTNLPAPAGLGLLAGRVLTPAVAALLLSCAAVVATARRPRGRFIRWSIITGAALMWLLLLATVLWSVAASTPLLLLRPDGPGPWSLMAAPAYTALARTLRSAPRRSDTGAAPA